jgi:hypothetical protein
MKKVIVQLGSNWNNGSNAGTFYWNVNNSVSNRNQNISGHLMNARCSREKSRLFQINVLNPLTLPHGKTEK